MSDTTPREQIAQIIERAMRNMWDDMLDDTAECATEVAAAIIAAGWRPPARVVSTVEEFDALVDGAVIRDSGECVAERWLGMWYVTGGGRYGGIELALPATVLYEPEEGE